MNKKLDFEFKDNLCEGLNEYSQRTLLFLLRGTELLDGLEREEHMEIICASHEERMAYLYDYVKGYTSRIPSLEMLESSYGLVPLCFRMAQFWLEAAEAITEAKEVRAIELKNEKKVN